ncbi:MAG: stage II sporulation protein R [Firmicutes bacterium]|nr:stage II sporulation protein R [Bacillota bacterium]
MKHRLRALLLLGILVTGSLLFRENLQAKKAYTRDNLIRLHIIANSDEARDQAVKYRVRDALIESLKPRLKGLNYREVKTYLEQNRVRIAKIAAQAAAASGFSYPVRVEVGRFEFPARAYGDVVYPAGRYEAVRVVLGKGEGSNWWCVLFPPLCFVDLSSANQTSVSQAAGEALTQEDGSEQDVFSLRLRVWDWLQDEAEHLARLISS